MHLFNLHDFSLRVGIDMSVPDFNAAVTEASKAATRTVASRFRFRDFARYTARRDVFNVRRMFDAGNTQNVQLRLSRGFIDTGASFSALYTANPLHVRNTDANSFTNLQRVNDDGESDYLFIDADQGVLTVYTLDLTDQWVVVTYDCGLTVASDGEFEDVPDWLAEAAELHTMLMLQNHKALQVENADTGPIRQSLNDLLAAHGRLYPGAILPTMSEPGR